MKRASLGFAGESSDGGDYSSHLDVLHNMADEWRHLQKGWKKMPAGGPARQPRSIVNDPLALTYSQGYKERRSTPNFSMLRRLAHQVALIAAIHNTRIMQVASFCQPYARTKQFGFELKFKDTDSVMTESDKRFAKDLSEYIMSCGRPGESSFAGRRDNFEDFTKKVIRDRLVFDQATFEIIPTRRGLPFEFIPVDAATIRIAAEDLTTANKLREKLMGQGFHGMIRDEPWAPSFAPPTNGNRITHVQLIRGQIENIYYEGELGFCIANPRSDIYANGYGYSELEQLITIITSHLHAEEYNRRVFMQGSAPKGILNIKGDNIPPEMLESFKRQWHAMVTGVENAWKTPVLQADSVEYNSIQNTNQEMEYNLWLEYLTKIITAVYLIDPAEINFDIAAPASGNPMFESTGEWKIKKSRDRGLRPLLRFYASCINEHIIDKIDPRFHIVFVGLDELSDKERIELRQQQVQTFKTLNEVRDEEGLEAIDDGDVVLNPAYLQYVQMQQEQKAMEQQQGEEGDPQAEGEQQGGGGAPQEEAPAKEAPPEEEQGAMSPADMHNLPVYKSGLII